jgi:hypothetical protein
LTGPASSAGVWGYAGAPIGADPGAGKYAADLGRLEVAGVDAYGNDRAGWLAAAGDGWTVTGRPLVDADAVTVWTVTGPAVDLGGAWQLPASSAGPIPSAGDYVLEVAATPAAAPLPTTGWPTVDDLAAYLGGAAGTSDPTNVQGALDAAIGDAIVECGVDADTGATDWGQFRAVTGLGAWWYQSRNRQDYSGMGPDGSWTPSRRTWLDLIRRGRVVVA